MLDCLRTQGDQRLSWSQFPLSFLGRFCARAVILGYCSSYLLVYSFILLLDGLLMRFDGLTRRECVARPLRAFRSLATLALIGNYEFEGLLYLDVDYLERQSLQLRALSSVWILIWKDLRCWLCETLCHSYRLAKILQLKGICVPAVLNSCFFLCLSLCYVIVPIVCYTTKSKKSKMVLRTSAKMVAKCINK